MMTTPEQFMLWFRVNYPGGRSGTIIIDPDWHAPKIYRAAIAASPLPELLELAKETEAFLESVMLVRAEPDLEVTNDLWNKWKRAIDKAAGR